MVRNNNHSFKILPRFWLVKTARIIHSNQLLLTKFGENFVILNEWCEKVSNPMNQYLFQRPKSSGKGDVWCDNVVVGENTLGKRMKVISQQAELSTIYTNHSIRATTITILDKRRFEAWHMSVSGHRNESSIKSHSKTDENTKNTQGG